MSWGKNVLNIRNDINSCGSFSKNRLCRILDIEMDIKMPITYWNEYKRKALAFVHLKGGGNASSSS